jgi:hypothetical protein
MKQTKNILIAGDSWGCGEWGITESGKYGILHSGLAGYLNEAGHKVVNLSRAGGSNRVTAERLEDFCAYNSEYKFDHIIVFVTSWTRDFEVASESHKDIEQGYEICKNQIISRFYYLLSRAAMQHKITIHVIGGFGDVLNIDKFENEYPGVKVACQSFMNLLFNNKPNSSDPVFATFPNTYEVYLKQIKKYSSSSDIELLLKDIQSGENRENLLRNNKMLFPDLAHPSRQCHLVLYDFLKETIGL